MISVIIPTFNGQDKIINCLTSLDNQSYHNFEVIVVIDGSNDNTIDLLNIKTFNHLKTSIPVKIHYQENSGRASVRNTGASLAKGDILLFLDDDMRLEQEVLKVHALHHTINSRSVLVGNQIEDLKLIKTDFQRYKANLSRKWANQIKEFSPMPLPSSVNFLTAAHFSIPKDIFSSVGSFIEGLTDAEDYELASRLKRNDIDIYFNVSLIGWHDDFITCKKYIKRQNQYLNAHRVLKENHGSEHSLLATEKNILKKIIYFFLSHRIWPFIIDHVNWLRVFPKKIRYYFYNLVITAHIKSN